MNNITVKRNSDNIPILYFSKDYGAFLDGMCSLFNFEKMGEKGISSKTFIDYLEKVTDRFQISRSFLEKNCDFLLDEFSLIVDEFKKMGFDIEALLNMRDYEKDNFWVLKKEYLNSFFADIDDAFTFENMANLFNLFMKFQVKAYKCSELINLKDSLFLSFKDVTSLDIYNDYEKKCNIILNQRPLNINELENLYREIQKIILDDFKSNVTDVDEYKPGLPFRLLCHSTTSVDWDFEYPINYVSTSLLSEQHMDTYHLPYGLIMDPNYIVTMGSDDLHVKNDADNEDDLSFYSVLPQVCSMDNLLKNTVIYNEVVVEGFHPIGVFCINDGSKELNPFYLRAKMLHESFSDLPFIDIDMTLYISSDELKTVRDDLIYALREELAITTPMGDGYFDVMDIFWEKFMEMKKTKDYSIHDIISLFIYYHNIADTDFSLGNVKKI